MDNPNDPTPAEIRALCEQIRERGFEVRGAFYRPWGGKRLCEPPPVEAPFVELASLPIQLYEE